MDYKGKYKIFNSDSICTYPVSTRKNKVSIKDLANPGGVLIEPIDIEKKNSEILKTISEAIVSCRKKGKPVILFTGAHLVKNGLSPLLIDLIRKKMITLVAGNCATAIHDFELALFGETSEDVPDALQKGQFGMAFEFNYFNKAIEAGNNLKLGLGESIGKLVNDSEFMKETFESATGEGYVDEGCADKGYVNDFRYPDISIAYNCYLENVPFTIHTGIGTDVIDQHSTFNGSSKGGCSGRDFLIFVEEVSKLSRGGVYLNIGSAVTGPEVLLKAVSMCANAGKKPRDVIFADFDIRPESVTEVNNDGSFYYYFRDQKSITTRIPKAFNCRGYYVHGNINSTFRGLYKSIASLSG